MSDSSSTEMDTKMLELSHDEQSRLLRILSQVSRAYGPVCYHCGSLDLTLEGSFQGIYGSHEVNKCHSCDLVQLSNRLTEREIAALEDQNPIYSPPTEEEIEQHVIAHSFMVNMMEEYLPLGSMLEIGTGPGFKLEAARRRGWEVEGIELSERSCRFIRQAFNIRVHLGPLETFIPGRRYDAIVMWHVLEHALSIHSALSRVRALLASPGFAFIQVPSYGLYKDLVPWNDHPEMFCSVHNWFFTSESLPHTLAEYGLKAVNVIDDEAAKHLTVIAS
jgi:2-polyprenyl-3-methyl-5-hydroxy-6-metoxy-1,4-benzoquinol methylase